MRRAELALAGFLLCACSEDPVYVLGRLPGSGGAGPGGCAVPEPLRDYVFEGTGTSVADRRGGPPGEIRGGAALDGSGELTLDGEDDYVDLPNGILAGLSEVTVVAWMHSSPRPAYRRIFDFGVGSDGEDPAEGLGTVGRSYLAATPMTGFVPDKLAALISERGSGGEIAAPSTLEFDDELHLVAVGASSQTLDLFYDGVLIGRVPNSVPLANIDDVNNWLGRSQYDADPHLRAGYRRVQIYGRALPECAVGSLFAAGP